MVLVGNAVGGTSILNTTSYQPEDSRRTVVVDVGEIEPGDGHGFSEFYGPPRLSLAVAHHEVLSGAVSSVVADACSVFKAVDRVDAALIRRSIQGYSTHLVRVHCTHTHTHNTAVDTPPVAGMAPVSPQVNFFESVT